MIIRSTSCTTPSQDEREKAFRFCLYIKMYLFFTVWFRLCSPLWGALLHRIVHPPCQFGFWREVSFVLEIKFYSCDFWGPCEDPWVRRVGSFQQWTNVSSRCCGGMGNQRTDIFSGKKNPATTTVKNNYRKINHQVRTNHRTDTFPSKIQEWTGTFPWPWEKQNTDRYI